MLASAVRSAFGSELVRANTLGVVSWGGGASFWPRTGQAHKSTVDLGPAPDRRWIAVLHGSEEQRLTTLSATGRIDADMAASDRPWVDQGGWSALEHGGETRGCVMRRNGTAACFEDGVSVVSGWPVDPSTRWLQLKNFFGDACGIKLDGRGMVCWTARESSVSGPGAAFTEARVRLPFRSAAWRVVGVGSNSMCGIDMADTLFCTMDLVSAFQTPELAAMTSPSGLPDVKDVCMYSTVVYVVSTSGVFSRQLLAGDADDHAPPGIVGTGGWAALDCAGTWSVVAWRHDGSFVRWSWADGNPALDLVPRPPPRGWARVLGGFPGVVCVLSTDHAVFCGSALGSAAPMRALPYTPGVADAHVHNGGDGGMAMVGTTTNGGILLVIDPASPARRQEEPLDIEAPGSILDAVPITESNQEGLSAWVAVLADGTLRFAPNQCMTRRPSPALSSVRRVWSGGSELCVTQGDNATLFCWSCSWPTVLPPPSHASTGVVDASMGTWGMCVIVGPSRRLECFPLVPATGDLIRSTRPAGAWSGTAAVAVGVDVACAINASSSLVCWGLEAAAAVTTVPLPNAGWTSVAFADGGACGLRGGAIICWGATGPTPSSLDAPLADGWDASVDVDPAEPSWPSTVEGCWAERRCKSLTAALGAPAAELAVRLLPGAHSLGRPDCRLPWGAPATDGVLMRALIGPAAPGGPGAATLTLGAGASILGCGPTSNATSLTVVTAGRIDVLTGTPARPAALPTWPGGADWAPTSPVVASLGHSGAGTVTLAGIHARDLVLAALPGGPADAAASTAGASAASVRVAGNLSAAPASAALAALAGVVRLAFDVNVTVPHGLRLGGMAELESVDLFAVALPGGSLPDSLFAGASRLSSVSLPSGTASLGTGAFAGTAVRRLGLAHTALESLGSGALGGAASLRSVGLPPGVRDVGAGALDGAASLTALDLSASLLTELRGGALRGLPSVTSLLLPPTLASLGEAPLDGLLSLPSLNLTGTRVARVPAGLCRGAPALAEVLLPATVTAADPGAFAECGRVARLNLEGTSLAALPADVLDGLTALPSLALPAALASAAPGAFRGLAALTTLDLSATSLAELPAGVVSGLGSLASLRLPASLSSLAAGWASTALPALASLSLEHTALSALPAGAFLPGMPNLTTLALGSRHLTTLAPGCASFDGLTALANLTVLPSPRLGGLGAPRSLPRDGWAGCAFHSTLRSVSVTGVDLGSLALGSDLLRPVGGTLRSLTLSRCNISVVLPGALTFSSALESLVLSGNAIDRLPQLSLAVLDSLTELDLAGSPLSVVSQDPFLGLLNLRSAAVSLRACDPGTTRTAVATRSDRVALCVECDPGRYCDDGVLSRQCPRDTYNPASGAASLAACLPCPPGTSTSAAGVTDGASCVALPVTCDVGKGGRTCELCGPGTASAGGLDATCVECRPGTASTAERGSVACERCPAGTFTPSAGAATPSACLHCGAGLFSLPGDSACRGCPAGARLAPQGGGCVPCLAAELCPAGLPGPVEPVEALAAMLAALPPTSDGAAGAAAGPAQAAEARGDAGEPGRRLHIARVARAVRHGGPAAAGPRRAQAAGAASGSAGDSSGGSAGQVRTAATSVATVLQLALVAAALCSVLLLGVLLAVPVLRPRLWRALLAVDGFRTAHTQPRFAAVRVVPTSLGGVCTIAAFVTSLAFAASLTVGFASDNTSRASSLMVEADGVLGIDQARAATTTVVLVRASASRHHRHAACFPPSPPIAVSCRHRPPSPRSTSLASSTPALPPQDVVHQPMTGIPCASSAALTVLPAAENSLTALQASAATSVLTSAPTGDVCRTHASCTGCSVTVATALELRAHWSAQALAWRLATVDAEGRWVTVDGSAAQPGGSASGAVGSSAGVSLGPNGTMLALQTESVSAVPHIMVDSTPAGRSRAARDDPVEGFLGVSLTGRRQVTGMVTTGFIPQDLQRTVATGSDPGRLDPSSAATVLRVSLERSAVYAELNVTETTSLTQLLSAVAGIVVGVLGAFSSAFRVAEARCGLRLQWMCGPTGRIASEEAAMRRRGNAAGTSKPKVRASMIPTRVRRAGKGFAVLNPMAGDAKSSVEQQRQQLASRPDGRALTPGAPGGARPPPEIPEL